MTREKKHPSTSPSNHERLPHHIAFVMDGNGRWAKKRGRFRVFGHQQGAESLRRITRHCRRIGVKETTFYALSTENFARRPEREIAYLMKLLERYLIDERPELVENGIRLTTIGDIDALPESVRRELATTMRLTESFDGMTMRLALNYGARQELLEAVKRIARAAAAGRLSPEEIDALDDGDIRAGLADPSMSDPDLVIRTAGEYRLSNFLLWQSSYSEWWVTDILWPDFDVENLEEALRDYARRERRFGAVEPVSPPRVSPSQITPSPLPASPLASLRPSKSEAEAHGGRGTGEAVESTAAPVAGPIDVSTLG
jgi:undecaprenyl diphosphate synthase